ncbi:hypothetical protein P167DRAFT_601785 [Morchella conica CCBAS932]|uniref:Uncharacterized protein n=1 Tax=Morchella conica CCBAS932 TaxID=1392247 RepID=A0A3N4L721_9PEZI|nr:hypothetical protein P167DRAFT_601785 [Morchella conica CCBAS932]
MASTTTSPARTPLASPPSAPSTPVKPKRRPPRYKNPETAALRTRCRTYLDETDYSLWSFTDFWGGDEAARVSCQEMWHRELLRIINADKDPQRAKAAVVARNKYKQRGQVSEVSNGSKAAKPKAKTQKHSGKSGIPDPPQPQLPPPAYEPSSPDIRSPNSKPLSLHEQKHESLSADRRWNLPTGRSVEDVLFSWVVSQSDEARRVGQVPRESYAHSYILDVEDPNIKRLFDDEEWGIIVSRLLPLPAVDDSLRSFMYKFADAKNTSELRHLLISTPYISPDKTYSLEKHGDQAWVHSALSSLVILYEHSLVSGNDNLEAWFQINVWGPIFDRCFQHIPNISVKRTESQSLSNTTRKNPHPPTTTRKCIGNRYDGLITHNRLEYGAVEDSKDYEYKKWASDSLKLVKVLHDQLRGLETEVRHVTTALEGFRCVGFLTAGLECRGLFMQYGGGHVCLLSRSEGYKVPEAISPVSKLIAVLVGVWQMREVVRASVGNLEDFLANTEMQFKVALGQMARLPAILPVCMDTDADF